MELLGQNFWNKYGFKNNPYDTTALTLYADALLPIPKAYVGRGQSSREFQLITNIFRASGGNRFTVEGEIGVGKTTFVNYHRYLWENEAQDRLFTPWGEITFSLEWTRANFLQEVLSHLTTKLYIVYGDSLPVNNELYQELLALNKVFVEDNYQWQLSVMGVGVGGGKDKQVFMPKIAEARLYSYYRMLVETIMKLDYTGVVLHFDNMELLQYEGALRAQKIFEEIRDLLQVPNVYYVFIGKSGFFNQVIAPLERVRSIFFGWPIHLKPLSKEEVFKIFELRYELLSSEGMRYVRPIEDELVSYLYDLYQGKIRFIMDAVYGILANFPLSSPQAFPTKTAKELLVSLSKEKIRNILTERELEVLLEMVAREEFTNIELAKTLQLQRQNISKYIRKLLETGYVILVRKEGRKSIYQVTDEIRYLREMMAVKPARPKPSPSPKSSLNLRQRKFLTQTDTETIITTAEYVKIFKISRPTALKDLNDLTAKGILKKSGKKKGVYFEVIDKYQ